MAKVELKGSIVAVSGETLQKETRIQKFVLSVPGYVDEYGEKRGKDEMWQITLMNKKIDENKLDEGSIGKKVKVTAWLNSDVLPATTDKPAIYIINAVLGKIEYAPALGNTAAANPA